MKTDVNNEKNKSAHFLTPFFNWWKINFVLFKDRRYIRLEAAIHSYSIELEEKIHRIEKSRQPVPLWADAAKKLLSDAESSLKKKDIDQGWKYFFTAQRMEIYGMEKDELEIQIKVIKKECTEKLGKWKNEAVEEILDKVNKRTETKTIQNSLYQATLLRDEDFNNQYYKIGLKKDQLKTLCFIISATLLLILLVFWRVPNLLNEKPLPSDYRIVCAVLLSGLLGGSVSALLSIARASTRTRIPEQISTFSVTMVRTLIGAAAALIIFFLLYAGAINLNFETSTALILAISFIAGFSERFFKSAIESVAGKEK